MPRMSAIRIKAALPPERVFAEPDGELEVGFGDAGDEKALQGDSIGIAMVFDPSNT